MLKSKRRSVSLNHATTIRRDQTASYAMCSFFSSFPCQTCLYNQWEAVSELDQVNFEKALKSRPSFALSPDLQSKNRWKRYGRTLTLSINSYLRGVKWRREEGRKEGKKVERALLQCVWTGRLVSHFIWNTWTTETPMKVTYLHQYSE